MMKKVDTTWNKSKGEIQEMFGYTKKSESTGLTENNIRNK